MDGTTAPRFDGVIPLHLLLATSAKVLASALWVSNRSESEAWRHSVFHALQVNHLADALPDLVEPHVDAARRRVRLDLRLDDRAIARIIASYRDAYPGYDADWAREAERLRALGCVTREAQFTGSQGSVILPTDGRGLQFDPVEVTTTLPDAEGPPWPEGDGPTSDMAASPTETAIAAAIDEAVAAPDAYTAAVVVVHRGRIVGEGYREGFGMHDQLESWSMGKSVTATLLGILVGAGHVSLDQTVPVPAWQQPGDPRAGITVRQLLQMSSGLRCPGYEEPRERWPLGLPDHFYIYGEALDTFRFGSDRAQEYPPGTVGRYRNCDPLVLGWLIRETIRHRLGEDYLRWPQKALFDAIGIRRQTLETDLHGNFLMPGFNYGTPRNWARLGLLYLDDGIAGGRRVLPEGWTRFVSSPAPAWTERGYGALFWLNTKSAFPTLPRDAYYMAGGGDQLVFVIPSEQLVIVRMGHQAGHARARPSIDRMLDRIMSTVRSADGRA